jgi:hypothetical protein
MTTIEPLQHGQYRIRIDPETGEVTFVGIDWESRPVTVWHRTPSHIVFKIPSGKHWESILNPSVSHPGHYLVCEIVSAEQAGELERLIVSELFSMPLSKRGGGGS